MLQEQHGVDSEPLELEEWRKHQFATAALMMLDRLDVSPEDQLRVQAIATMVRKLAGMEK